MLVECPYYRGGGWGKQGYCGRLLEATPGLTDDVLCTETNQADYQTWEETHEDNYSSGCPQAGGILKEIIDRI